ncbi:Tetratricopeptide repeat-containing protein [Ekhidna lutea]|uniref:Tetratricopeptide repeat-containing protein n=1 Tax=Ekhidna lutea TaxID=447679 RepID=A0A239IIX8_EKHLU|nr:tetratricopeptide repeat protein [Ekhidna lutea]SNS93479.1 Tetratricopeptide repeat-containing protein [Ekhidna lutea]
MLLKRLKWLTLTLICLNASGQTVIDSLEHKLQNLEESDSHYLVILTKLAKEYAETQPDTALILSNKALQLSQSFDNGELKGQIYIALSTSYSYLANYEQSTTYSFKAIEVAEQYNDTITLIDGFNNLGIDYLMLEEDQKAINYFKQVESLSKQFGDTLRWGHALNNLGMMASYSDETERELNYYEQAASLFQAIGEKEGYANTLLNSGTVYSLILEQYAKANELYDQALEVFKEIEMSSGIQNTIQSKAENLMYMGRNAEAKSLALEALNIAQNYKFAQDEVYTYDLLSKISVELGDYQAALEYLESKNEIAAEIFTEEKSRQIAELETKYQTEKKEQELAIASLQLIQQKREKYFLSGVIIFIVLVGGFIIYSLKQKSNLKQKLLSEEIENLRLKINSLLGDSDSIKLSLDELNQKLHQPLTEREFEILNLTVSDKTNQEIAEEVFVSVNTVKYHLKNVYEKLGVNNRKEALHLIVGQS